MIQALQDRPPVMAKNRLSESPITELRELVVEEDGERLLISGQVRSFYHKQLAQETVRQFADGRTVLNHVNVQ